MPNYNSARTGMMAKYDANNTVIMVNSVQMYGFSDNQMFQVTYTNDNITVTQDAQGTAVGSINNKTGATITINLNETSPSNNVLTDLANRKVEFPIDIRTSTAHYSSAHCYISKIPDSQGGTSAADRAWQIHALNLDEESTVTSSDTTNNA